MKKLIFCLSFLSMICLCGCQKNDCQTFIQGEWTAVYPDDTSYIAKDSVNFYQADSIAEFYAFRRSPDTLRTYYSSYFITDQCNEIDFNGTNTWDSIKKVVRYHINIIKSNNFQIISFADSSSCTPCVVTFHR